MSLVEALKIFLFAISMGNPHFCPEAPSSSSAEFIWPPPPHTHSTPKPDPRGPSTPYMSQCSEKNEMSINNQTITWPNTEIGEDAVSDPLCLDESFKIVTRHCDEDGWADYHPDCAHIQLPINPCPTDLTPIGNRYCYKLLQKTTFPPQCPYSNLVGWDRLLTIEGLFPENVTVWMPVMRGDSEKYGIDVYRFTEVTLKYKMPFSICTQSCKTFFYADSFMDKKCQVYHNSTHMEAVSCNNKYAALCVYDALAYQQSSLCGQYHTDNNLNSVCKQSGYSSTSQCFCKTTQERVGESVLAEFLNPYENLLFQEDNCRIGLNNNNQEFIWIQSQTFINYSYWAPTVNFNNPNGVLTPQGWVLHSSNEDIGCYIYFLNLSITVDNAQLDLQITNDTFYTLTVSNYKKLFSESDEEPLIFCFTDADAKSIIYRSTDAPVSMTEAGDNYVFTFPPLSMDQSGPGHYWCEAFVYPNLTIIRSNNLTVKNYTAEYVVLLQLTDYDEKLSAYPLTQDNLDTLQTLFKNELPNNITFYPRIFKINDIDEATKRINVTFHLTSSDAVGTTEEFKMLKLICRTQQFFKFLDFRSVNYCPSSVSSHDGQTIVWPQTGVGESTWPLHGHCVTSNVTLLKRSCIGNFIDGATWASISEKCYFYVNSSLTNRLINIVNAFKSNETTSVLQDLLEATEQYSKITTLDFVLAVLGFTKIVWDTVDLDMVAEIVSNLMEVSRAVLLSAQLNFRSTDILLESLDAILENGDIRQYEKANFAIVSADLREGVVGVSLENCNAGKNCNIILIKNDSVVLDQKYKDNQTVEALIRLSPKLYEQIIDYSKSNESYIPKLIFSIYYGSQFFVDLQNSKTSRIVFGVLLPEFEQVFQGPVLVYYYNDTKTYLNDFNCSYWKFNPEHTGLWSLENTIESNNYVVCEFYHITNFALPGSTECSITEDQDICAEIDNLLLSEFCVTKNFTLIPTSCFTNFNGSEYVQYIKANCSTHQLSEEITLAINMLTDGNYDYTLTMLLSLTEKYETVSEVELLIIVTILKSAGNQSADLDKVAEIINNIMQVPRDVLSNVQRNFKLADDLLLFIDSAVKNGNCLEWKTANFVIKCMEVDETFSGLILKNCNGETGKATDCELEVVTSDQNFTEVAYASVHAAILISDPLRQQLINYSQGMNFVPKLAVCIYYGDQLFIDFSKNSSMAPLVFGILLPGFEDQMFNGPILISYLKDTEYLYYNCSYWQFDNISYGSWIVEFWSGNNGNAVCQFNHLTNVALSFNVSSDNIVRRLNRLRSLDEMVDVVDEYLKTQDLQENADKILHSIDAVLLKANETLLARGEHVMFVSITPEDAKTFQGFLINEHHEFCSFLDQDATSTDWLIKVSFTENLQQQIKYTNSSVKIAIFFTEQLFPAMNKLQLPIVEILIPLVDELSGGVAIRFPKTFNGRCAYWNHGVEEISGQWIVESEVINPGICLFNHVTHFALVASAENITTDLEQILASNLTGREKLKQVASITTVNYHNLVAIDIFLISQIITNSLPQGAMPSLVSKIISNLFLVPRGVLRQSQQAHSATDIILYLIDKMAAMTVDLEEHHQNFSLIVKNLDNLTGIVLRDCINYTCTMDYLKGFVNVSDYSANKSIAGMVVFSEVLLNQLKNYSSSKVIISIFDSDVLFNEAVNRKTSRIFGVTFPGFNEQLNGTLSVVNNVGSSNKSQCAYWDFQPEPTGNITNATLGQWRNDSANKRDQSMVICNYNHVTHFGMLLSNSNAYDDDNVLNFITDIGCILSLIGILIIFITAILFTKWRQNTGNKILLNFSVAILLKIITLYLSVYVKNLSTGIYCTVTGALLHYVTLSECTWMLTIAILQFKRFVEVLGGPPKYVLVKALICGWCFPIIPVACVLGIDRDNYQKGLASLCYPSELGLYLGIWLPVLLILVINFIIFIFIIYNVFHKKTEYLEGSNHDIMFQWRLALLLFFMLGLNWTFGFLGQINGDAFFTYLYSITASLQGFVLFLFFIVFNGSTRLLYTRNVKHWFLAKGFFRVWHSKSDCKQ